MGLPILSSMEHLVKGNNGGQCGCSCPAHLISVIYCHINSIIPVNTHVWEDGFNGTSPHLAKRTLGRLVCLWPPPQKIKKTC